MSATKIEMARPFVNEIIFFFRNQIAEMNQPDLVESLEVAIQCIEAVYSLPDEAIETAGDRVDLFELYENSRAILPDDKVAESEHLKNEGNRLMKEEKYAEVSGPDCICRISSTLSLQAISMYTQAINIDSRNPIFYCNRAAAWTRTGDYEKSISDANLSLRYNPRYSKAFVRQVRVQDSSPPRLQRTISFRETRISGWRSSRKPQMPIRKLSRSSPIMKTTKISPLWPCNAPCRTSKLVRGCRRTML